MRNESTKDRLIALETQMKILSASKSCVDTSSPSNYDKTSGKPMTDSVVPIKKTAKSLESRHDIPKGENHSIEMNLDYSELPLIYSIVFT